MNVTRKNIHQLQVEAGEHGDRPGRLNRAYLKLKELLKEDA